MADDTRPDAHQIYERVVASAEDELDRTSSALAFSALFAGIAMGLSGLGVATASAILPAGGSAEFVAALLYPLGFVAVILGRAQLFTENTLYPVVLTLGDRRWLIPTARLWLTVFAANIAGAFLFALLAAESPALEPGFREELARLGDHTSAASFASNFWSGVIGGTAVALVAWLVEASDSGTARFAVIFSLTFLIGLGAYDHCIASAGEVFAGTLEGEVGIGRCAEWLAAATLGNIAGGVLIVSLLNFAQVRSGGESMS